MPNFKIISPQGTPFTITSNAATWGELKNELSSRMQNLNSMSAILGSTKNSLEHDDAALPESDDKIFFTVKQMKAGWEIHYN